jgi:protein arginine N-methyltransferase 1
MRSVAPTDLLTPGATWATIDYSTALPQPVHGRATWRIHRQGVGHGLILWFEAELAAGVGFSTAPGIDVVYPQLFLPWADPVPLHEGDEVGVELWAQPEGESWGWNSTISRAEGSPPLRFRQSSFLAELSRPPALAPRVRSEQGKAP